MHERPTLFYTDPKNDRKNSIIRYIGKRVLENNDNFVCALTGQTGKGKSWASGSIAEIYSKMFDIDYDVEVHMFFSLKELLNLINYPEKYDIKPGSILQYDESQTEINARSWQSEMNQIISSLVSTFRNMRLIVLFPTPNLLTLDRQTRMLFKGEFKILGYDKKTKKTKIQPRIFTDYNYIKDRPYAKMLRVKYKVEGKEKYSKYLLNKWEIPKPSDKWVEVYEKKKIHFTKTHNLKLLRKLEAMERREEDRAKYKDPQEEFYKVKELYFRYGYNYTKILSQMPSIAPNTLQRHLSALKRDMPPQDAIL